MLRPGWRRPVGHKRSGGRRLRQHNLCTPRNAWVDAAQDADGYGVEGRRRCHRHLERAQQPRWWVQLQALPGDGDAQRGVLQKAPPGIRPDQAGDPAPQRESLPHPRHLHQCRHRTDGQHMGDATHPTQWSRASLPAGAERHRHHTQRLPAVGGAQLRPVPTPGNTIRHQIHQLAFVLRV